MSLKSLEHTGRDPHLSDVLQNVRGLFIHSWFVGSFIHSAEVLHSCFLLILGC